MSEKKVEKNRENKIHTYYEIKEEKIIRKLKKCPRCGSFMARHNLPVSRLACGRCSYTEYTTSSES